MSGLTVKKLFQIEAIGALLSGLFLSVVLVKFKYIFGIPPFALYILAIFPILFALYDLYCLCVIKDDLAVYLKWIAFANLLYCVFSIIMAIYHRGQILFWGWSYIVIEVVVVLLLARTELQVAQKDLQMK